MGGCDDSSKSNINYVYAVYKEWQFLHQHQHPDEAFHGGWKRVVLTLDRQNASLVMEYVCDYSDFSRVLESDTLPALTVLLGTCVAIAQNYHVAGGAGIGVDSAVALVTVEEVARVNPADVLVFRVVERLAPERYVMHTSAKLQPQSTTEPIVTHENAKDRRTESREPAGRGPGTVSNKQNERKRCRPRKKINVPATGMDFTLSCSTRSRDNDHTPSVAKRP